jgi:hypothetical protein
MRKVYVWSALLLTTVTIVPAPSLAKSNTLPPSATCYNDRKVCLAGHALVGSYGVRYVPAESVRLCESLYRRCIGQR